MAKLMTCFSFLLGGDKKRSKVIRRKVAYAKKATGNDCPPKVTPVEFVDMPGTVRDIGNAAACDTNVSARTAAEPAPQGRDASNEDSKASSPRGSSHAGLAVAGGEESSPGYSSGDNSKNSAASAGGSSSIGDISPELQRSCSNIETARSVLPAQEFDDLRAAKSRSYGDLMALPSGKLLTTTPSGGAPDTSPTASSCSASPRNDSLDAVTTAATAREPKNKEAIVEDDPGVPSQWVALSPLDRVSAWVNSLQKDGSPFHVVDDEEEDVVMEHGGGAVPASWCSEIEECPSTTTAAEKHRARGKRRAAEEAVQAASIVPTLNAVASVAHISGMGLKAVPMIAAFSSLRAVNLSANFIVHISPGSLPKGLRSLDLSRNRLASIEGLRELTRLRVLNLGYNRISRIGHGLSSCTAIRELYLAGNKVSDVEGLHRLLKLAVLDVSFNKITTAKSLGQLVANYASLRALNLVGNPVQANVGDDTLRKAVEGLLPRLEYLNKQALKPQRAREVAKDSVAQAALGNGGGARNRRAARRVSQSPGSSRKSRGGGRDGGGSRRGSRSRSKNRGQGSTSLATR